MLADVQIGKTCAPRLRLVHIVASRQWCFKKGTEIVVVRGEEFFDTRAEAVSALGPGVALDRNGCVTEKPAWIR